MKDSELFYKLVQLALLSHLLTPSKPLQVDRNQMISDPLHHRQLSELMNEESMEGLENS